MIELRTLGAVDLRSADGVELRAVLVQPKRTALLAYLAVADPRGFHRRDSLLALFWLFRPSPPKPFAAVMTVGGPGLKIANSTLPDLFGVAIDGKGHVFFSDGTGDAVRRIDADGDLKTIAADLDTPSGLAFEQQIETTLDALADHLAAHLDLDGLLALARVRG